METKEQCKKSFQIKQQRHNNDASDVLVNLDILVFP